MGVSYSKHKANRARPWPRYRIAIWGTVSETWVDLPMVYYSPAMAISAGQRRVETFGDKVRVCAINEDGTRVDMSLDDFEKQNHHG
jgi:hypothetical protein